MEDNDHTDGRRRLLFGVNQILHLSDKQRDTESKVGSRKYQTLWYFRQLGQHCTLSLSE